MSLLSKIMGCFPALNIFLLFASFTNAVINPSIFTVLLIPFMAYLFPLICFRIHCLFWPVKEGKFNLELKSYNPWWGGHQIQLIFYSMPFLESILRIIPGAFSFWLRLWGSKIGKGVYWTPNAEIDDRSLVEFGDNVVMGHKVEMISHVIGPKDGKLSLLSKKIKLGNNTFIGAGSRFGPGSEVEDGAFVPVLTDVYINRVIKKEDNLKYKGHVPDEYK